MGGYFHGRDENLCRDSKKTGYQKKMKSGTNDFFALFEDVHELLEILPF